MPPFVGVAVNVTAVPTQIVVAVATMETLAVKIGFTTIVFDAKTVPQMPPLVVSVNVIVPVSEAPAVYVAVPGVEPVLFAKAPVPPVHTAAVARPPKEPSNTADVVPWHIAAIAAPAETVGLDIVIVGDV